VKGLKKREEGELDQQTLQKEQKPQNELGLNGLTKIEEEEKTKSDQLNECQQDYDPVSPTFDMEMIVAQQAHAKINALDMFNQMREERSS
jgi:hypothetical protein